MGIAGLEQLRAMGSGRQAIFYVLSVDPTRPTPSGALGITNRPHTLLHLVIDGLERARWSDLEQAAEQSVADETEPAP